MKIALQQYNLFKQGKKHLVSRAEDFKNVISEIFTWTSSHIHVRDIEISIDVELVISIAGKRRSGRTSLV